MREPLRFRIFEKWLTNTNISRKYLQHIQNKEENFKYKPIFNNYVPARSTPKDYIEQTEENYKNKSQGRDTFYKRRHNSESFLREFLCCEKLDNAKALEIKKKHNKYGH